MSAQIVRAHGRSSLGWPAWWPSRLWSCWYHGIKNNPISNVILDSRWRSNCWEDLVACVLQRQVILEIQYTSVILRCFYPQSLSNDAMRRCTLLTRFDCGTLPLGSVLLNWKGTKERWVVLGCLHKKSLSTHVQVWSVSLARERVASGGRYVIFSSSGFSDYLERYMNKNI